MRTFAAVAVVTLLFLQASGLDGVIAPRDCSLSCTGDGPDGDCAPLCPECVCCPTLRTFMQAADVMTSPLASAMAPAAEPVSAPRKARPNEIFHIPKSLPA